jgi:hypothetical protein
MSLDQVKLLELPKVADPRGNLTFIEEDHHIPFPIKRVFFIYDIPSGEDRGAHAHYDLHQCIVCLSGGLDVRMDDGRRKHTIRLNRPWVGLYIPPLIWASEGNFDPGTVYLVLTSDFYRPESYIRDFEVFLKEVGVRD